MNQGAMSMKGYSAFPKSPVLLEPNDQIVKCHIHDICVGWSYPSSEMQSVYSTALTDLVGFDIKMSTRVDIP